MVKNWWWSTVPIDEPQAPVLRRSPSAPPKAPRQLEIVQLLSRRRRTPSCLAESRLFSGLDGCAAPLFHRVSELQRPLERAAALQVAGPLDGNRAAAGGPGAVALRAPLRAPPGALHLGGRVPGEPLRALVPHRDATYGDQRRESWEKVTSFRDRGVS